MGMAASQVRLLQLTSRKNTIGRELSFLSMDKMALTRDMEKVSREYQDALSTKTLKWSNNAGVSYIDLTYDNLMKPSEMNQQVPYLLTDTRGMVVVDREYEKYAKMISPDGKPGGDWESVKTKVLSELTGIDADKLESQNSVRQSVYQNQNQLDILKAKEPQKLEEWTTPDKLLEKMGTNNTESLNGETWTKAYSHKSIVSLGNASSASAKLSMLCTSLKGNLGEYFGEYQSAFVEAVDEVENEYTGFLQSNPPHISGCLSGDANDVKVNVKTLVDLIMGKYVDKTGNLQESNGAFEGKTSRYLWYDLDSDKYQQREEERAKWQATYDEAQTNYDSTVKTDNQLFTATEERLINYYDSIFSAIAEKGWTMNNQVGEKDYLNQMLQNNMYTLTKVERNIDYNTKKGEIEWSNEYDTDIASNFDNIFPVNDNTVIIEAQSDYEAKKNRINEKEQRIDTRMKNLETEQSAINQMIQGIEAVRNKNIETNFAIFG